MSLARHQTRPPDTSRVEVDAWLPSPVRKWFEVGRPALSPWGYSEKRTRSRPCGSARNFSAAPMIGRRPPARVRSCRVASLCPQVDDRPPVRVALPEAEPAGEGVRVVAEPAAGRQRVQ